MHRPTRLAIMAVVSSFGIGTAALAAEPERPELAPATFEEALPDEPRSVTVRWTTEYSRSRAAVPESEAAQRVQVFFGMFDGLSGEVELPFVRRHDALGSTWGMGRAGLGLKFAPLAQRGWPIALRAEVELPTASQEFPEDERHSTGALFVAGSLSRDTWAIQADVGYESTWDRESRSVRFDVSSMRAMTPWLAWHLEGSGEREISATGWTAAAGPGVSVRSSSGLTFGAASLLGLNADSERFRLAGSLARRF